MKLKFLQRSALLSANSDIQNILINYHLCQGISGLNYLMIYIFSIQVTVNDRWTNISYESLGTKFLLLINI